MNSGITFSVEQVRYTFSNVLTMWRVMIYLGTERWNRCFGMNLFPVTTSFTQVQAHLPSIPPW